jgi:glucose-1-phosphate thymidylyltransferase
VDDSGARPKAVAHYLLEKMKLAGVSKAYFVLRAGKWDIPAYFGDGSVAGLDLAYLVLESSPGVPFTIDHAYPFVKDSLVAFGFPDILFSPDDAFVKLLARHSETQPDIVLGLVPTDDICKYDAVKFDKAGVVEDLIVKPADRSLRYSWANALWTPAFSEFVHDYVRQNRSRPVGSPELIAGHAIGASVKAGLRVEAVVLGEEPYLDIGTPKDLVTATRRGTETVSFS